MSGQKTCKKRRAADGDLAPTRDAGESRSPLHRLAYIAKVIHRPLMQRRRFFLRGGNESHGVHIGHGNSAGNCCQVLCNAKTIGEYFYRSLHTVLGEDDQETLSASATISACSFW